MWQSLSNEILLLQTQQQSPAALAHIAPCGLEVARIPWVGHVAHPRSERLKQLAYLALGVAATDARHVSNVPPVHAHQQVEAVVVGARHLPRRLARTAYAVFGQLAPCRRIDGIAYLLGRRSSRLDVELVSQTGLVHQLLHHKLGHRTAANIAVAHKQYAFHLVFLVQKYANLRGKRQIIGKNS